MKLRTASEDDAQKPVSFWAEIDERTKENLLLNIN